MANVQPLLDVDGGFASKASPRKHLLKKMDSVCSTPMSEPSTAPPTPLQSFRLLDDFSSDDEMSLCFTRHQSIAEESEPSDDPMVLQRRFDRVDCILEEVKTLYKQKYGHSVDDEEQDFEYDADGMLWIISGPTGPMPRAVPSIATLENMLVEVKELYAKKYGQAVDETRNYEYDADGTLWLISGDIGPMPRAVPSHAKLESMLVEVKELYKKKYGQAVDETRNYEYDADGTLWLISGGTGPMPRAVPSQAKLESMLVEVKELYKKKYGKAVDQKQDFQYDADGTLWLISGIPEDEDDRSVPSSQMLEDSLAQVKELFKAKFGYDVDDEVDESEQLMAPPGADYAYDANGTLWMRTRPVVMFPPPPSIVAPLGPLTMRLDCCTLQ